MRLKPKNVAFACARIVNEVRTRFSGGRQFHGYYSQEVGLSLGHILICGFRHSVNVEVSDHR